MSTAYSQHIHTILFTIKYPVDWLCCLYMLPLHNVIFFHNYCTIDSTTIFPAYPQHIPTVLFTITLTSILTLLFIYASFTQCDIFSQLLHNWLCNNVYSIFATYTYGNVYNHTSLYTGFAVYICFPFHNMIFFHNYCPINSTTMFTAYPQHIHTVLFTITLPSILTLLFTHAFLFTMWIFSTHYCTIVYMTMFTLNLHCYILYCIQLLLPVY